MRDPAHDFRMLKQAVPIVRFLRIRGLAGKLRQRGPRLVGPCPIHHGDNPTAFVVDVGKNVWHCFTACGEGGDVVDLVRKVDGVGYAEAARRLAAIAALPAPAPTGPTTGLPEGPRQPFRPFTRSLALDADVPFLRAKGIAASTARWFEAGEWHGLGFLAGCVGVRLHDPEGRPLGYAGRRLDPAEVRRLGKWKFPSGLPKSEVLYGVHRLPDRDTHALALTECPWGVMRLHQLGIPAVALLGTTLTESQRCLLVRAHRVVLLFDGDPAGHAAAQRVRRALDAATSASVADLPDGTDPDDLSDRQLDALVRPLFLS